jgi:signal peptidase I
MRRLLQYAGSSLLVVLIVMGIRTFCAGSYRISTASMGQAPAKGDFILVNKIHSRSNPGLDRVVLYRSPLRRDAGAASLFLSRCVGMPGDTVRIDGNGLRVNGRLLPDFPPTERTFRIQKNIKKPLLDVLQQLQIPYRSVAEDGLSLTLRLTSGEEKQVRENLPHVVKIEPVANEAESRYAFVIPFKGFVCRPDSVTLAFYRDAIRCETGKEAEIYNGRLLLDGKEEASVLFGQNYYWMWSDRAAEAVDSRHLGAIPASRVIGNVWFCWYSKDRTRIFKRIN